MTEESKKKFKRATIAYWFLLFYIVAALIWWFISLEQQNATLTDMRIELLQLKTPRPSPEYEKAYKLIINENKRGTAKYISEGITFLILTLVGATFVYRSVRNQIRLQRQQQNFMMAVTHELKTPISIMRLNLETLQKHQLETEKQQKIIQVTLQETNRLNDLTNNILVSSQLEGEEYKAVKEKLDLSELVKDRVKDFALRFPDRVFEMDIAPGIKINGDELLLQMMVNNLLQNAIKYSPKTKPIHSVLYRKDGETSLRIIDEGDGIAEVEKPLVFDKFYRVGNEMTRKAHGTGLGLYLCKKIAEAHFAEIKITDNLPKGTIFNVHFR